LGKVDKSSSKVAAMFNSIAPKYDFLNHFLSLGIDRIWRRKLVNRILKDSPEMVLDVATGTADLAIVLAKRNSRVRITGIDISDAMIAIGENKVKSAMLHNRIDLKVASALKIPFPDNHFDAAMVAFGVRNFENLAQGLKEIYRVLMPNSVFAVLEFSMPKTWPFNLIYRFYFKTFLPWIGGLVSGNRQAYSYLPDSVVEFPQGQDFVDILKSIGFDKVDIKTQTFGVATIYIAKKSTL